MDFFCICTLAFTLFFGGCSENTPDILPEEDNIDIPLEDDNTDFTVMSYNIHYGRGIDGTLNLDRIAGVIKAADPDILVLNEVDRNYDPRSNYQDQLEILAEQLDMYYQFQKTTWKAPIPASSNKPREFGHAVLSKYPVEHMDDFIYKKYKTHYHGLLETRIKVGAHTVYVYATHLDVDQECLESQVGELLTKMSKREGLKILCGDLNATPDNIAIRQISNIYTDAFKNQNSAFTFKSNRPTIRIDYIFGSENIVFKNSTVFHSLASDHLPIISEVCVD